MTTAAPALRSHFTVDDLEQMPPVLGARYEIVDGELYVSTAPSWQHQTICGNLYIALHEWGARSGGGRSVIAAGLVHDPKNSVIPDVVWASPAREGQVFNPDGKLRAPPDLVAEVLSPGAANAVRDRDVKLGAYSRWGVREYWIVDWQARTVEVYRPSGGPTGGATVGATGGALRLDVILAAGDSLTSPILPGFHLPLPQLFANLP